MQIRLAGFSFLIKTGLKSLFDSVRNVATKKGNIKFTSIHSYYICMSLMDDSNEDHS